MENLTSICQGLRQAARRLRRTPRFAALAILMLSLALGAHLSIVAIFDTVLLQSLPVTDPGRLLTIHETRDGVGFRAMAYSDYLEYRAQSQTFEDLAVHYSTVPLYVGGEGAGEMMNGSLVSANYFPLLGLEPTAGRFFRPEEDATRASHPVVVISEGLWRSRFGGREDVVGSVLQVNSTDFSIVGVAPPGFVGLDAGRPCALWMPTMMAPVANNWCDALAKRNCRLFEMVGRLADGQDVATAQAEMSVLSQNLHTADPLPGDTVRGLQVTPLTGLDSERGQGSRRMMALLMAVVTLLVAVACANLSGLLIARGLGSRTEIAVRLALGARRHQVVSLFVAEALLLTVAATVGGLCLATLATPLGALVFQTHADVDIELTPALVGYAVLLCGFTAWVVGLLPGLQASRPDLIEGLKESRSRRKPRLLAGFVVAQIAISFLLLYGTGLFARSLLNVDSAQSAEAEHVAKFRLRPRLVGYGPEQGQAVVDEVLRRIEALPGVRSVGFAKLRPLWPGFEAPVSLPDSASDGGEPLFHAGFQPVGPKALASVGIELLRGRDFDRRDVAGSQPVLLVNRTMAENLWPTEEAVGQRVTVGGKTFEVVGIVQDSSYNNLIWGRSPQAFGSFWQDPQHPDARFVVRFEDDAKAFLPTLRQLVAEVDPVIPVTELGTLQERLRFEHATAHVVGRLTAAACILAVLLSAAGLSGILALAVAQRVREVGIRRALGASHSQVAALVARDAFVLVAVALVCGLVASVALAPTVGHFLYGVHPRDPGLLGGAFLLLIAVAGAAAWWPALRAVRIDPVDALRQ